MAFTALKHEFFDVVRLEDELAIDGLLDGS
jgi:hypothetical protein